MNFAILLGPLGLGAPELVLILLLVLVVFGASRLPQLGKGLGEGISNFKRGMREADRTEPGSSSADDQSGKP